MAANWFSLKDAQLLTFAQDFSAKVTASAAALGLLPADATQLATFVTGYASAYDAAKDPTTRTKVTVEAKDLAKALMVADIRVLGRRIQANPAVTDTQKVSLGMPIHDSSPTPQPPPATKPVISVVGVVNRDVVIRLVDEATPTRRARPAGAIGAQVYSWVGPTAPSEDMELWRFEGLATKGEFTVGFNMADGGKTITLAARWFNRKGEVGPLSDAIETAIALPAMAA